jgi:hypothetical protein
MTLWVFALMVEEFYMHLMHERCIEVRCVEERLRIVYFIIFTILLVVIRIGSSYALVVVQLLQSCEADDSLNERKTF